MSPIGRVFLVLNLGLAGAFVAFSGTYLQRAHHWREQFEDKARVAANAEKDLKAKNKALQDNFNDVQRQVGVLTTVKSNLENQLSEKNRDNASLQGRLTAMEATAKSMNTHLGSISSELASARKDAKDAMDRTIAAEKVKDESVSSKLAAEKSLDEANFKIKNLETSVSDKLSTLAMRDQTIRQKDVLLDLVNRRLPGVFETLHPLVKGTVSKVGATGNMVTIQLADGADNLQSGARFAIFNASEGYKGEATVSEVDGSKKFCFARLTLKQGKTIRAGDSASTNLSN